MDNKATFTFGRFNPPTTGHKKLVDAVVNHAKKNGGKHYIFLSHTQDSKKNPLSHEQKVGFAKKMFPKANVVSSPEHKTIIHVMKHLQDQGHNHVTMVVGDDRVDEMHKLLHSYNGKEYNFKHIEVKSAGHRDPDAEGTEGMSASKQREHAKAGDFKEFSKGVPVKKHAKELYTAVRKGLKLEHFMKNFKALFLVGGPGSGKDFLIHSVLDECNLKEVSLDKLFTAITEQTNIDELNNFPSIVVNGNADNKDKVIVAKTILEAMGYDTAMIYVYTTEDESKSRNDMRIARGAKTFTESVRAKKYNDSIENMHVYVEVFESFVLYDNSNNFSTVSGEKKQEIASWLLELSESISGFLSNPPSNEVAMNWIVERVLEVGTDETAQFAKALTPGQGSNEVKTYAQADKLVKKSHGHKDHDCGCDGECECEDVDRDGDKYKGGVRPANANTSERTVAEAKKEIKHKENPHVKKAFKEVKRVAALPPSQDGDVRNMAVGSTGVASAPIGLMTMGDEKKKKKFKKFPDVAGFKSTWNTANFGNPDAGVGITAYKTEGKTFDDIRNKISSTAHNLDEELG